jgi:hypothetical protein
MPSPSESTAETSIRLSSGGTATGHPPPSHRRPHHMRRRSSWAAAFRRVSRPRAQPHPELASSTGGGSEKPAHLALCQCLLFVHWAAPWPPRHLPGLPGLPGISPSRTYGHSSLRAPPSMQPRVREPSTSLGQLPAVAPSQIESPTHTPAGASGTHARSSPANSPRPPLPHTASLSGPPIPLSPPPERPRPRFATCTPSR